MFVCTACGTSRKGKNIKYHPETGLPYCSHAHICNDDHPNTSANMLKRGFELVFTDASAKKETQLAYLMQEYNEFDAREIEKLMNDIVSVRLGDKDLAEKLFHIKIKNNFRTVSDAVRYCIEHFGEAVEQEVVEQEVTPEPEPIIEKAKEDEEELVF